MSTTEDQPAPEIGTPEWYRTLPPAVSTRGDLKFSRTHVWSADGALYGLISLGHVDLMFRTPEQVRDLIGQLAGLAGEMDAEIKRQRPVEVVHLPEPENQAPLDVAAGADALAIPPNRIGEPAPLPACRKCGATGVPLVVAGEPGSPAEHECHNAIRCAERASARDAEAAKPKVEGGRALLGKLVERSDDDAPVPLVGEIVGLDGSDEDGSVEYVKVAWGYPGHGNDDGSVSPVTEAMDELRPARTGAS